MQKTKKAVFTIIANNYLAQAKAAIDSFLEHNQNYEGRVVVVDENEGSAIKEFGKERVVFIDDLNIQNWKKMAFQYSLVEMCTAIKPSAFEYLFDSGFSEAVFIDPDTYFFNKISSAEKMLSKKAIVITPHIIESADWENEINYEKLFLKRGIYNLGFIALRKGEEIEKLLEWWSERLINFSLDEETESLFTDQKWFDLAGSLFEGVGVLKERSYNLAHWNLQEIKSFEYKNNKYWVNKSELVFYHFSQFEMDNLNKIGTHQKYFTLKDFPKSFSEMFEDYKKLLIKNRVEKYRDIKYKFDYLENGIKIPREIKRIYWLENRNGWKTAINNPFKANNSFLNWLFEADFAGSLAPRLVLRMFPNNFLLGKGKVPHWIHEWYALNWAINNLSEYFGFDNYFIARLKNYRSYFLKNILVRIFKKGR